MRRLRTLRALRAAARGPGSLILLLSAFAPPTPAIAADARSAPAAVAFIDVTVLPMDADRALPHHTVLVEGDRIVAVGPVGQAVVPASALRIDGRGKFLLPGFTDAHVHLYSPIELPLYLANGVTTVFNLNGRPAHLAWRERIARGELAGPAIVTTGPTFMSAHTPEEAARLVDEQAAAGYDGVKVYNQVGADELPAIAAAARRHRLLLTGHVARRAGFAATLAAGQSIAHAEEFMYTFFNPRGDDDSAHIVYDGAKIPEAVRLTKQAGIAVTPTLSMYRDILRQANDLEAYLRNPEIALLSPVHRAELAPGMNRYHDRYPPDELERMGRSLALQRKLVRALAEAGVPILAGTDATGAGPVAGFAIHEEIAELAASGLSTHAALAAATTAPARYFGRGESSTVESGQRADLVLLAADPRTDLAATRRIEGVMAAGRWRSRSELDALLRAIPPAYERELDALVELVARDPAGAERHLAANDPFGILSASALERLFARDGAASALTALAAVRRLPGREDSRLAGEEAMNGLGYRLLALGKTAEAIAVFEANVADFPRSSNALDSLADGHTRTGDVEKAVALYRRALALEPDYPNSPYAREFLARHDSRP